MILLVLLLAGGFVAVFVLGYVMGRMVSIRRRECCNPDHPPDQV